MSACPFCQTDLNGGLREGCCPNCNSLLEWREESAGPGDVAPPYDAAPDHIAPSHPAPFDADFSLQSSPAAAPTDGKSRESQSDSVAKLRMTLAQIVRRGADNPDAGEPRSVPSLMPQAFDNSLTGAPPFAQPLTASSSATDSSATFSPTRSNQTIGFPDRGNVGLDPAFTFGDPSDASNSSTYQVPAVPKSGNQNPKSAGDISRPYNSPFADSSAGDPPSSNPLAADSSSTVDSFIVPGMRGASRDEHPLSDPNRGPTDGSPSDSQFAVGPQEGGEQVTFDERRLAATMDSGQFTRNETDRIAGMWRGTYSPSTTPRMTIKGAEDDVASLRDSRLVIKPRAVKETDGTTRTGADYELLDVIGEGGVGVVYSARQASIDRNVAVKMLKPAGAANADQREKFLSEAVVTGDLDHPNIVPIYDLGTNEAGALFYSMKRVQGTPWVAVINKKPLPENLETLMKVADAVGFAHSRGVVHRDLKPENVMLGEFGEVLVMDWGLAMSTPEFRKAASITQSSSMGGTPAYMAPEMATGPIESVTPLADIYLLGAILYEIITGQPPHTGKNVMNCLFAAARNEIQPTTQTGELLDIALRSMSTAPEKRPKSARDFQNIIREYQSHSESITLSNRAEQDLVEAEADNDYQSFSRALFGFQEAAALWDGNTRARVGISDAKLAYARSATDKGDFDLATSLLEPSDANHQTLLKQVAAAQQERSLRQQRLRNTKRMAMTLAASMLLVITVALFWVSHLYGLAENEAEIAREQTVQADDARKEALIEKNKSDKNAELARAEEQRATEASRVANEAKMAAETAKSAAETAKTAEEYAAYIARIGLAAAKVEENAFGEVDNLLAECNADLRNWEWGRLKYLCGRALKSFDAGGAIESVSLAKDGQRFVTGSLDGLVRVWQIDNDQQPLAEFNYGGLYVHAVAFSPDGVHIAAGGNDKRGGFVKVWNLDTKQLTQTLRGHTDSVLSVTYSKDGSTILTSGYDNTARIWNAATGDLQRTLEGHTYWVWSAKFSPNEKQVVTASQDGTCIVWTLAAAGQTARAAKQSLALFTGHQAPVYSAAFSPDGETIVSGGYDRRVLLWNRDQARPFAFDELAENKAAFEPKYRSFEGHAAPIRSVQFSPDASRGVIISGSHDNTVKVWHVESGRTIQTLRGHAGWVRSCDIAQGGTRVLSGSQDQQAKLWNLEGYEEIRVLQGRVLQGHADAILAAAFSRDGQQIVTASRDRTAKTWDFSSGKSLQTFNEGHEFLVSNAAFLSDGRHFVTSAMDNSVRFWDITTGTEVRRLDGTGQSAALALSKNSKWILTGGNDKEGKLWELETGKLLSQLGGHRGNVSAVAFSPDDSLCVTCDLNGRTRAWDSSGTLLWSTDSHTDAINAVAFTTDGQKVLTASNDGTVGQFDARTGKELLMLSLKHDAGVLSLAITPDGKYAVTCSADHQVQLFEIATARKVRSLNGTLGPVSHVAVSPDGRQIMTVAAAEMGGNPSRGQRSIVQFWDTATGDEAVALRISTGLVWSAFYANQAGQVLLVGGNGARLWRVGGRDAVMSFSPNGTLASASFSPDGQQIVTGSWDSSAKIWDVKTGKAMLKFAVEHRGFVNTAVFSPDGETILTASDDRTAKLWNAKSGALIRSFDGHTDRVRHAAFSQDGRLIVTASHDKTARVWQVTGESVATLAGHTAAVISAAFSPDTSRVVTTSEDKNNAKLWDIATSRQIGEDLAGHTAILTSACFSPDGNRILTGSRDNTAKLWDANTGKEVLTLKGHTQEVTSVSFSDDGRYALTASREGTAIVWLADEWRAANEELITNYKLQITKP